jgi:arsenate reductase
MAKKNVLFVCTGNSCRSQMGEALLRLRGGDRFDVYSGGLEPKGVHPNTIEVLQEIGIDTAPLTSKRLFDFIGRIQVDYVITVCSHAEKNCPIVWPGETLRLYWPFDDPAAFRGSDERALEEFRHVRDAIDHQVTSWLLEAV